MKISPVLILGLSFGSGVLGSTDFADAPRPEIAELAWAATDAILARHFDPPTRQEMLLAGITAILDGQKPNERMGERLAWRVSNLTNPGQLAALLAEVGPRSKFTDPEAREEAFLTGLLGSVKGSPFLLSAKERKVTESMEANLYVGIQVALSFEDTARKPSFNQILEGGPADLAGLKAGDLIEEIDGVSALGMPLVKVVDRLRGPEGTDVSVKFSRPSTGEVQTKALRRSRLPQATIEGRTRLADKRWLYRLDEKSPIGYIKINEISGSTPRELRVVAEQLESDGVKALVLDLGEVRSAGFHPTVLLADALLDGGVIGRVASSEGVRVIQAEPDALFRGWPMVVMTGQVSVAEVAWLALALSDNQRATILGGELVRNDPLIKEIVALNISDWSVQMLGGRLERGDGRSLVPIATGRDRLASLSASDRKAVLEAMEQIDSLWRAKENSDISAAYQKALKNLANSLNLTAAPTDMSFEPKLARAREILEKALESPAK